MAALYFHGRFAKRGNVSESAKTIYRPVHRTSGRCHRRSILPPSTRSIPHSERSSIRSFNTVNRRCRKSRTAHVHREGPSIVDREHMFVRIGSHSPPALISPSSALLGQTPRIQRKAKRITYQRESASMSGLDSRARRPPLIDTDKR